MSTRQKFDLAIVLIWFVLVVGTIGAFRWVAFAGFIVAFVVQMRGLRPKRQA